MYDVEKNKGIIATKKTISPMPIAVLTGLIIFLDFIEKYINKPSITKNKKLNVINNSLKLCFTYTKRIILTTNKITGKIKCIALCFIS